LRDTRQHLSPFDQESKSSMWRIIKNYKPDRQHGACSPPIIHPWHG
jgi:hypothetical protein